MNDPNSFIREYPVGDKSVRVDALLVLSELTLSGATENPSPDQLIEAVRSAIRPTEVASSLSKAEAHALSLRIMMSLKTLGNAGAP